MPITVAGAALNEIGCPTIDGSPPNRRCQNPWLSTTTRAAPGRSSSAVIKRPSAGCTRSVEKNPDVTWTEPARSASPRPPEMVARPTKPFAPMLVIVVLSRSKSAKSAGDRLPATPSALSKPTNLISRSARSNSSGLSNTAWTTLKIAVVAPMPSESVTTAMAVKPGRRARPRKAWRRSWVNIAIWTALWRQGCRAG